MTDALILSCFPSLYGQVSSLQKCHTDPRETKTGMVERTLGLGSVETRLAGFVRGSHLSLSVSLYVCVCVFLLSHLYKDGSGQGKLHLFLLAALLRWPPIIFLLLFLYKLHSLIQIRSWQFFA